MIDGRDGDRGLKTGLCRPAAHSTLVLSRIDAVRIVCDSGRSADPGAAMLGSKFVV